MAVTWLTVRLVFHDNTQLVLDAKTPVTFGRATECTVRSTNSFVSRRHAQISFKRGKWVIRDLGSENGTRVNHQQIQTAVLEDNDIIEIADRIFRFKLFVEPELLN